MLVTTEWPKQEKSFLTNWKIILFFEKMVPVEPKKYRNVSFISEFPECLALKFSELKSSFFSEYSIQRKLFFVISKDKL